MGRLTKELAFRHKVPLTAILDDNSYIDINSELHWSRDTITDRQRLFIFYYICPANNSAYNNATKACIKAGYTPRNSDIQAAKLIGRADILSECRSIGGQLLGKLTRANIERELTAYIEAKRRRTKIVPTDYYTFERVVDEDGASHIVTLPKLPEELTPEQRAMIVDVEFLGNRGIVHYKLPNKIEAENELIKMWETLGGANTATTGYDIEATADIIRGNLSLKAKVIQTNSDLRHSIGMTGGDTQGED